MKKGKRDLLTIILILEIVICACIGLIKFMEYKHEQKLHAEDDNRTRLLSMLEGFGNKRGTKRAINYWSEHGVLRWSGLEEEEIDDLYVKLTTDEDLKEEIEEGVKWNEIDYTYEDFQDYCRKMLYGGIVFSEDEINMNLFYRVAYETREFTKINLIEQLYTLVRDYDGIVPDEPIQRGVQNDR